jgi:3-deoxy-D-manno-octulosonic acid kinase
VSVQIPAGFVWIRRGRRVALVRRSVEGPVGDLLIGMPHAPPVGGERLPGGRGAAYRLRLPCSQAVVFRLCLRGGLLGGLLRDNYLRVWPRLPRPFAEIVMTEKARERGVPGPEPLGARIDRRWAGWYRGVVVTRHLPAVRSLWECLREEPHADERRDIAHAAGRAVGTLWHAGIYHPDLNLLNCVVSRTSNGVEAFIVDFDRARMASAGEHDEVRERMLRRLERSARKLDPAGGVVTARDLRVLRDAAEIAP